MLLPTDLLSAWTWLLIGAIIFLARYHIIRKWQYLDKLGIPHDQPSITKFGNATDYVSNLAFVKVLDAKRKYGPVWGYYVGLCPRIVIHDASIIEQVLIKEFATFPNRQTLLIKLNGKELGSSLFAIHGQQWKRVRSTMTPTFSLSKLKQMGGIIDWCTDNTVKVFRKKNTNSDGTFNATRCVCVKCRVLKHLVDKFIVHVSSLSIIREELACAISLSQRDLHFIKFSIIVSTRINRYEVSQLSFPLWIPGYKQSFNLLTYIYVVRRLFPRLSMDVICSAAFSTKVNSQDEACEEPEITVQAKKMFDIGLVNPLFFICVMFPFLEPLVAKFSSNRRHIVYFRNLTNRLIEEQKKNSDAINRLDLMQLMLGSELPKDIIQDGMTKGMTRLEIIGNSMAMILAGQETTGNTMMYLAYNLAQHPEIQTELQEEIDELFESKENIDFEAVNHLKLLDMCLNESLRLYSPVERIIRGAEKEITINGLTIPAGMNVIIPIYALGHDPELWDEPMEFKPERMRDMSQIDPMVFNPFGAGPRNCIGSRFAIMEVKMAFCKFLHIFTFKTTKSTPKPPLKLKFDVTVRPLKEFHLCAEPRN